MSTWFETNKNAPQYTMGIAQLLMEQKLQRRFAAQSGLGPLNPTASMVNSSALHPLMSIPLSPQLPNKLSSRLMSNTLMILNDQAQQSRLQDFASVATKTSLALEMASKKKQEYQQQQLAQKLYRQQKQLPSQPQQSSPSSSDTVVTPSEFDV